MIERQVMKQFQNRSTPIFNLLFLFLMLLVLVLGSGCTSNDCSDNSNDETDSIPTPTPNSGEYNIDNIDIDKKPENYHPLKYKTSQLVRQEEIAFMLPDPDVDNDGSQAFILDDADANYAKISTFYDESKPSPDHFHMDRRGAVMHKTVAGDVTGDGHDELLMIMSHKSDLDGDDYDFYTYLYILHYDPVTGEMERLKYMRWDEDPQHYIPYGADLAVADIDNDGIDEIIVTIDRWTRGYGGDTLGNVKCSQIWMYDDATNNYEVYAKNLGDKTYNTKVAAGNIDDDLYGEIIATSYQKTDSYPYFKIITNIWDAGWAGEPNNYVYILDRTTWDLSSSSTVEEKIALTVGDFNNDHIDEFAIGISYGSSVQVESFQFDADSDKFVGYENFNINMGNNHTVSDVSLAAGDFDGDGADELTLSFLDTDNPTFGSPTSVWRFYSHAFTNSEIYDLSKPTAVIPGLSGNAAQLATGDVDHDGIDEIIIAIEKYAPTRIQWMRYNLEIDAYGTSEFQQTKSSAFNISPYMKSGDYFGAGSFMAVGDYDGDSLKVKYTDEHWVHMIDPVITAVLIAPPVASNIPQSRAHTHVTFGKVSETTVEKGTTFESRIAFGFSVEAEFSLLAKLAKAGVKEGVIREAKVTDTTAVRTESVTSFTGDCFDNYVIFLGTAYHSYKYEIIASPDTDLIGTYMTIDVPVGSGYWKWNVDYFNANNGNAPDIGVETFSNIPKQVASYPRPSERDAIISYNEANGAFNATTIGGSTEQHVNQGLEGFTSVGLTIAKEVSHEKETAWGWDNDIEASVCGIGGWFSSSITDGSLVKFTYSDATEYEAKVGDIVTCFNEDGTGSCYKTEDVDDHENYQENYPYYDNYYYSWGMFMYNLRRPDDKVKYNVINFWVDGLGPAYDGSGE